MEQAANEEKLSAVQYQQQQARNAAMDPNEDRDYPILPIPDKKSRFGSRQIPAYVKQGFPNVLQTVQAPETYNRSGMGLGGTGDTFPKIPGAEENYGMVYNRPETAAEKAMHELWMARRRQEVRDMTFCVLCDIYYWAPICAQCDYPCWHLLNFLAVIVLRTCAAFISCMSSRALMNCFSL